MQDDNDAARPEGDAWQPMPIQCAASDIVLPHIQREFPEWMNDVERELAMRMEAMKRPMQDPAVLFAAMERECPPGDYAARVRWLWAYPTEAPILRRALIYLYSFAIPNEAALDAIAALSPIVELGAGSGYWAHLLRQRGAHVIAYDQLTTYGASQQRSMFAKAWTGVLRGGPRKLRKLGDHTLFLCWPTYDTDFAAQCLANYPGRRVAYIGEGNGGCTGDDEFHAQLAARWNEVKSVKIPVWLGVHDRLYIYERR